MRKMASLVLLLTVFSQGCASSGASPSPVDFGQGSIEAANRALEGQTARIELAGGRIVRGAREVRMSPDSTVWSGGSVSGLNEVSTERVLKVTLEPKRRTLGRAVRYGVLGAFIGGALFFLGDTGGDDDPYGYTDALGGPVLAGSIVVGGLVGAAIGYARRTPATVVYSAPRETN